MYHLVQRMLRTGKYLGVGILGALLTAAIITLRYLFDSPQSLASILPGQASYYRWHSGHIFYVAGGDDTTPPLLLLHAPAIGASSYEMRKIFGALAKTYHVYALDLPGFGLSDRPRMDYSAETYIDLCRAFLQDVVKQPASILASGLSCNYALAVASRFPTYCSRLMLISPLQLLPGNQQRAVRSFALRFPALGLPLYAILSTRLALRIGRARRRQEAPVGADVDHLYAATHQFGAEHAPLAHLSGKLELDVSSELATLQQPVLMLWGTRLLPEQSTLPVTAHSQIALIQGDGPAIHEHCPTSVVEQIRKWTNIA